MSKNAQSPVITIATHDVVGVSLNDLPTTPGKTPEILEAAAVGGSVARPDGRYVQFDEANCTQWAGDGSLAWTT